MAAGSDGLARGAQAVGGGRQLCRGQWDACLIDGGVGGGVSDARGCACALATTTTATATITSTATTTDSKTLHLEGVEHRGGDKPIGLFDNFLFIFV